MSFRVSGKHVLDFHFKDGCGKYVIRSMRIKHSRAHNDDFRGSTGPQDRPLHVEATFTSGTRVQIDYSVGFTANVEPSCLDHDTVIAKLRLR